MKANPEDNYLQGAYAEVQISRLKQAIDVFTRKVAKEPHDPEPKEKLEQLKVALYKYELKEIRSERSRVAPTTSSSGCSSARSWPKAASTTRRSPSSSRPATAPSSRSRPCSRPGSRSRPTA